VAGVRDEISEGVSWAIVEVVEDGHSIWEGSFSSGGHVSLELALDLWSFSPTHSFVDLGRETQE